MLLWLLVIVKLVRCWWSFCGGLCRVRLRLRCVGLILICLLCLLLVRYWLIVWWCSMLLVCCCVVLLYRFCSSSCVCIWSGWVWVCCGNCRCLMVRMLILLMLRFMMLLVVL